MKIKVKLSRTKESREITLKEGSTVGDVLRKIKLKPDTVIVINNNTPVPVDDVLNNDQILTIIQVSSGG